MLVLKGGEIVMANQACHSLLGYPEGSLESRAIGELLEEGQGAAFFSWLEQPGESAFSARLLRIDGSSQELDIRTIDIAPEKGERLLLLAEPKAIKEVQQRAHFLYKLLNNLKGVVYVLEFPGKWHFTFVGGRVESVCGYTAEELMQRSRAFSLAHPDDRPELKRHIKTLLQKGADGFELAYRIITKSGKVKHIWNYGIFIKNVQGEVVASEGIILDFTAMQQAREEVQQLLERHQLILETTLDGFILADTQGRVVDVNTAYCKMTGYSREELLQMNIVQLEAQLSPEQIAERIQLMLAAGGARFETQHRHKDGHPIQLSVSISIMESKQGALVAAFCRDISEQIQAQKALKESEQKYRALFEQSYDAIVLSEGMYIVDCNQQAARLFGYEKREELLGMAAIDLTPAVQPGGRVSLDYMQELVAAALAGEPQFFQWQHKRKDGSLFDAEISLGTVTMEGKIYIQAIVRDITERLEARRKLTAALQEVEALKKQLEAENLYLQEEINLAHNYEHMVFGSEAFASVLRQVEQVAPVDVPVLVTGETGTGKELIVRAIHKLSSRSHKPLVKVNCAALPRELIESELFGHEKGAFTGATQQKLGRFELARDGTLFLDEIGELPLDLQPKLLRVLQEGELERVGGTTTIPLNVRVIAATNRDLQQAIREGTFREDLYYRLHVFPIHLPPLRERKEDIPHLVRFFLEKYSRKFNKAYNMPSPSAMKLLMSYDWPGNVRELENMVERALVLSRDGHLPFARLLGFSPREEPPATSLKAVEKNHILQTLEACGWKINGPGGAAQLLGLKPTTLRDRMKKLGIQRPGQQ